MDPLTSLWAELPASLLVLPDFVVDCPTSAETSPLNFADYLLQSDPAGLFGKTSPAFLALSQMDRTVRVWTELDPNTGETLQKRQILRQSSQRFESAGIVAPGGCWTLNFSEYPSDAVECSLSDILETTGDHLQKYFLSKTACLGILKRAEKRGKTLPELLTHALKAVVSPDQTEQ